jgi:hypothetical protein
MNQQVEILPSQIMVDNTEFARGMTETGVVGALRNKSFVAFLARVNN